MDEKSLYLLEARTTRRRFVAGVLAGSVALGLPKYGRTSIPNQPALSSPSSTYLPLPTLKGKRFDLHVGEQRVNFTGMPRTATTVNGSLPAPILRWKEGDEVVLRVTNHLSETSSIHWHGIILPSRMDGVPKIGSGFEGIRPGETFTYRFKVNQSGTYWYHGHSGFQEQTGLYGPIIIDPLTPEPFSYDRDYVVMLSDWTDEKPMDVYAKLKKQSDYYNYNERTVVDLLGDLKAHGLKKTWKARSMWNRMRMSQRDLSDVTGATYTYLMNGKTPEEGWMGLFEKGEKIRLRIINGSAMTFFDVRIPGLKMTVISADGQDIEPVTVDEIRLGAAETYDVIVAPESESAYTLFAQDIARSGYARGTLTSDPAVTAAVPTLDAVPSLMHQDMGGAMAMPHHAMHEKAPINHSDKEYGPQVDMRVSGPKYRLDDPGVGLRNNGRRVLTYADLHNRNTALELKDPDREMTFHLTGNMHRYMWSINGVSTSRSEPLRWRLGERLRIVLINDTMMNHPMHLHGMWSELENGDRKWLPRKHTVVVPPGGKISYQVTVDAEGHWAYHCHLLYHMLGMFRTVIVR